MTKIAGVRFRGTGKAYYFDPGELELAAGDMVIVETASGRTMGEVRIAPREVADEEIKQPLKPILEKASPEDVERAAKNKEREKEAFAICKKKIREHGLQMKLVDAEYTYDNRKLIFCFTADDRVDFRALVRDLAGTFHTRIELRQIGVRDETRIMGGLGTCGRELCCKSWLVDFAPVSIKMAKEQNLSLNPTKISGVCGRLMCCLKNEAETYEYLNSNLPHVGDTVRTPENELARVQSVGILRQTVRVILEHDDEKEMKEYPAGELEIVERRKKGKAQTPKKDASGENGGQGGGNKGNNGGNKSSKQGGGNGGNKGNNGGRGNGGRGDQKPSAREGSPADGGKADGAKDDGAPRKNNNHRSRNRRNHNGGQNAGNRPDAEA